MKNFSKNVMMAMIFAAMMLTLSFASFAEENNVSVAVASALIIDNGVTIELPYTTDQKENAAIDAFLMMNDIRKENGLKPLSWNDDLGSAAKTRAEEATVLWSHTRPDGRAWYTVNEALCYGENLANGYTTAENAVNAWMASPEHKANILRSDFESANIQIVKNTNGTWYWAEEFC